MAHIRFFGLIFCSKPSDTRCGAGYCLTTLNREVNLAMRYRRIHAGYLCGVNGFTLIEVIVTMAVVSIIFLGTFTLVRSSQIYNSSEQERSGASAVAAEHMENVRQTFYPSLQSYTQNETLWDHSTPDDTSDDVVGQVVVQLYDLGGNALSQSPASGETLQVIVAVRWFPQGSRGADQQEEILSSYVTP